MNQNEAIVLIGPPGSGKGTMTELAEIAGYLPLSASGILRKCGDREVQDILLSAKSASGSTMVPDEVATPLFLRALGALPPRDIILDGLIRTVYQMKAISKKLSEMGLSIRVIHMEIPTSKAKERMLRRGRPDDTPEKIDNRLKDYELITKPVVSELMNQAPFYKVDASLTEAQVRRWFLAYLYPPEPIESRQRRFLSLVPST